MTLMDCAVDSGMSYQTILLWVKKKKFPIKRKGLRQVYVEPADWKKFCDDKGIVRGRKGRKHD